MIRINLSISSFKKGIKRTGKIAVGIILAGILVHWMNFLYNDYKVNRWNRIMWHNYYEENDNIDYLFLGSSHVYCDIDPFLLDELSGKNNFNLSTGSQKLNGSYYLLREADSSHHVSHVYLELYYEVSTGDEGNYKNYGNLISNWRNTDFMKFSLKKIEYMMSMSEIENYPETFLPFLRYRTRLFDTEYIKEQIEYKRGEEYNNYKFSNLNERNEITEYRDKGYCYTTEEMRQNDLCFLQDKILEQDPLTKDAEYYLRKIIEYCQEKDIKITLFSSPMYELEVISLEGYDSYVEQISRIAAQYNVAYYDFNLCRKEYLPIQEIRNFKDMGHLNSRGAEIFTAFFWKVMEDGNKEWFYDTYAEKLESSKETVYGLIYTDKEEERNYRIASNRERGIEYRIGLLPEDEEDMIWLQDYSENESFSLKKYEHGTCRIEARRTGEEEAFQMLEISY